MEPALQAVLLDTPMEEAVAVVSRDVCQSPKRESGKVGLARGVVHSHQKGTGTP